jgi:signal transduction histidine kinase
VYAVLFPMKFALFLPPFSLYLLFIISVNDFRGTLSESATRRKDYLSSDGIVRAIGHSVGADKVSLFIRIPGVQKIHHVHEERVLPLVWHRAKSGRSDKKLEEIFPVKADPFLLKMLNEQDSEMSVISANGNRPQNGGRFIGIPSNVELTVPIKFHGGVIGILQVNLRGYARFNHTTLQKLRLLADLVAPSVQSFRALAAVDQIGFRLARLQVSLRFGSLEMATQSVLRILHDVLSPLGTGLFLEMGFVSTKEVLSHSSALMRRLEDQAVSSKTNTDSSHTISVEGEDITLVTCPMFIRTMEVVREDEAAKGPLLGTLRFVIPTEKDQFSRPTLAAYYLNRKTAASLTADGILDLTRDFFSSIIKDLGVSFSRDTLSREAWFASIVIAINKAGLLWVVAVAHEGEEISESAIQLVSELDDMQQANLRKQILSTIASPRDIVLRNAIRLNLGRSKHELWIGLERDGFGRELTFESPWKVFLNDLRDMSDTALDTLEKRQVAEVEKLRTAQYQGVMTIAVTTGTLMHQLVNMIKDQLFATESLEEALAEKKLQLDRADATLLTAMKRSAGQMRVLTEAFKSVTKMEERRPCSLREAAEQAMKLFQVALIQRKIETRISISPQIIADVPFHVAAFALANLIGNAKEAIKANGRIDIEAEEDGKFVLCHVTNSGPQISEADRKHLFQFGKSTKPGHNGWGLYFVSRSLQENGGAINVDEANPETRFTIRLPKPDHE